MYALGTDGVLNQAERGFTFIELLITIGVVALALLAVVGTNMTIQQTSEVAFERTTALQDANEVIEQMRNAASGAPAAFQATVMNAGTAAVATAGTLPASHNEVITITYVDTAADPLDATVTVSWNERGLRPVSVSIRTLFTRRA